MNAYLWAMSIVVSRGISGRGYPFTLVPFIDLANHSMRPNAAVQYNEATGSFSIKTVKDVVNGQEITISYGDARNNSSIVGLYGFYEQDNLTDDLVFSFSSSSDASQAASEFSVVSKAALNYYTAYKDDSLSASMSATEKRQQDINVCRVVLKDALHKIFSALSAQGEANNFENGIPTRSAELKAIDMMLVAAHQKIDRLKRKRKEIESFGIKSAIIGADCGPLLGGDSGLICPHWKITCLHYVDGDLKDNLSIVSLLEDFKVFILS